MKDEEFNQRQSQQLEEMENFNKNGSRCARAGQEAWTTLHSKTHVFLR